MKYKCIVDLEPLHIEVDGEDYNEAAVEAIIQAVEKIKSTPFKQLARQIEVKCYKLE